MKPAEALGQARHSQNAGDPVPEVRAPRGTVIALPMAVPFHLTNSLLHGARPAAGVMHDGSTELPLLIANSSLTPWNAAVAHYIARLSRLGRRVKLQEAPTPHTEPFPRKAVLKELHSLRKAANGSKSSYQAEKAPTQIAVLETCAALSARLRGRKPNVIQVLAALALRPEMGGLSGSKFMAAAAHMEARYRNQRQTFGVARPWVGQPRPFVEAFSWQVSRGQSANLGVLALEALAAQKGAMRTTKELADDIGLSGPSRVRGEYRLNSALQVLSLLGVVDKHPYHRDMTVAQPLMVWSWGGVAPLKRELSNLAMRMLERAATAGPFRIQTMYAENMPKGGDRDLYFGSLGVLTTGYELQAAGLATLKRLRRDGEDRSGMVLSITRLGRSLISSWIGTSIGEPLDNTYRSKLRPRLLALGVER